MKIINRYTLIINHYYAFASGILHSSSGFLPQTEQSPIWFLSIGLLVAHVPRNSLPVNIWRRFISANDKPNTTNMIANMGRNVAIILCIVVSSSCCCSYFLIHKDNVFLLNLVYGLGNLLYTLSKSPCGILGATWRFAMPHHHIRHQAFWR